MTGFLSKPVPKATLLNVVRRAVAGFGRSGGPEHPGSGRRTLEGHVLDELEQSLGRDEFVRLLATFRRSTAEKVALLEEALGAGRRKEVGSLAHDLKGAAASVGAGLLADAAAAVVEACRAGDAARARTGIEDLRARAVETLRELESRPHTIGAG